jgi:hypothetical protein
MSKFKFLNENINSIISLMLENQKLCKLIEYNTNNPFSEPDIDPSTLLLKKVFPLPKFPEVTTEMGTYLNIYFDNFTLSRNVGLKEGLIVFDIISHLDLWVLKDTGMIRPLSILHEIDETFNNKRVVGVKKLLFYQGKYMYVNEKYAGYKISYEISNGN